MMTDYERKTSIYEIQVAMKHNYRKGLVEFEN